MRPVDALYLAHALWPTASSHRLQEMARQLGISKAGLPAHTADGDAALLVRLLEHGAADWAGRAPGLRDLVADVCEGSDAWQLMGELAQADVMVREPHVWEQAQVARVLGAELAQHPPRRLPGGVSTGGVAIAVPDGLRGADGRVDPTALARTVHGAHVEPRPAQQEMAQVLHTWADQGVSGLLEAPTGTGKSYAVLAAALEWLASGEDRTAVIATYTKQLQSQMAKDLQDLDRALPGILGVADLVKGKSNRLFLAALTKALADATRSGRARPTPAVRRIGKTGSANSRCS